MWQLFFFFFLHHKVCGILVPWPGIEPRSAAVKDWVLTTGPPGKSPDMTAIKKKRCILLTPHVYLLTFFWEVQSSLLVFSPPYPYGPPFWRKDRKMRKVREWVRCHRRPGFFHFNSWLWFVPAFSVPISKHKLDAVHSSCVCVCVEVHCCTYSTVLLYLQTELANSSYQTGWQTWLLVCLFPASGCLQSHFYLVYPPTHHNRTPGLCWTGGKIQRCAWLSRDMLAEIPLK